jgi:hypothetical protein
MSDGTTARQSRGCENLEVAVGLEPTKTGFADQRLDHFGIATKLVQNLHLNLH